MLKRILLIALAIFLLTANGTWVFATQEETAPSVPATEQETIPAETEQEEQPEVSEPAEEPQEEEKPVQPHVKLPRFPIRSEVDKVRNKIMDMFDETLAQTGLRSLRGYCGLEVSWQLYLLGINSFLVTLDGNNHYDYYAPQEVTSGGFTARAYNPYEYTMLEALNAITQNGTKDAYNIMVCFQKTNTDAGQIYGHVTFIHAIIDGIAYFTEGFPTAAGSAGSAMQISLEDYPSLWAGWTWYEGIVYFGTGDPMDDYNIYKTDLFVQCTAETAMMSLPGGKAERMVANGERLLVNAVVESPEGELYYRLMEDGELYYVAAQDAEVFRFNTEGVTLENFEAPQALAVGQGCRIAGKVSAETANLGQVSLTVSDAAAQKLAAEGEGSKKAFDLADLARQVDIAALEEGAYWLRLTAQVNNPYVQDGQLLTDTQQVCLWESVFSVGEAELPAAAEVKQTELTDGWYYFEKNWYCYRNGAPRYGWVCADGVDYYLDENGCAVTGWMEINGKYRYFTQTGAMRTGWLKTTEGTYYLLRNGTIATGWRNVDGQRYLLNEEGLLCQRGWLEENGKLYFLNAAGCAVIGCVELEAGRFVFDKDGSLTHLITEGEAVAWDGSWCPTET